MNYFTITTNKETALAIEQCFHSIMGLKRSIKLGKINHEAKYSTIQIIANPEDGKMNPEDIFWMGFYSNAKQ